MHDREQDSAGISRRKVITGAAVGAGALLGLPGAASAARRAPFATSHERRLSRDLAPGMYGGPTGFKGAERYQYPLDSEEGRAISALRALKKAGKAPDTLIVQTLDFAKPQFEKAFPKGALSVTKQFEKETGIKIKFVLTTPADEYKTNLRNASSKNASFDAVTFAIEEMGDFAEAKLIKPLDAYVAKYKPAWNDPKYGFAGGESAVNLFSKYNGRYFAVAFDNDTQPFFYRGDLFDDPKEKAAYSAKYGKELRVPETWDEHKNISEFFTRPDKQLYGDISTVTAFWCTVNWNQRFVCSAAPNNLYFKPDGSANVNNANGVRVFAEMLKSMEYHEPGALEKDWLAQYKVLGGGNGVLSPSFPNLTKIMPGNPAFDTADVGKYVRAGLMPGRNIGGKLVRRPVIFYNITYGVNNHVSANRQLATYLFLQWAGASKPYTWLTFNPAGYQDPHHKVSFTDPYVIASYKKTTTDAFKEIVPRTAPPITIRGGSEYRQALSDQIQNVLTKQVTPEQGAKNLQDAWDATTDRIGAAKQAKALKTFDAAFPTIIDKPT
ncbi:MAG: multiple sugar transport system substrate-binding protein [Gaiellales bacterium]|jgi:multiple sugar transport system substrate-binding protein|nr:multiple sugar transport system substrate-binding protein [Gaiellales bacterium]